MKTIRVVPVALALSACLVGGCARKAEFSAARAIAPVSAPAVAPDSKVMPAHGAMLEVHANLAACVKTRDEVGALAHRLEELANESGGYVASSEISPEGESHVVLRVPAAQIDRVRTLVSRDGATVTRDAESATDVSEAIADIDARVHNTRIEESRIAALLDQRTGALADVLTAERALSDVRERIERLEATQRSAHGRVDLATVDVVLTAQPPALALVPFRTRIDEALRDGIDTARTASVETLLVALRTGPILLMLATILFAAFRSIRAIRRRLRRAVA